MRGSNRHAGRHPSCCVYRPDSERSSPGRTERRAEPPDLYENVSAWVQNWDVPRMPDGQEPSPAADGTMRMTGPLGYTRHPLNWSLLLIFWLNPRMTTRLLAFNVVMTAYLFLGSVHAEAHMLRFYGDEYCAYQDRVPFFGP